MGMVSRKRGMRSFISYTDKWTALSCIKRTLHLDANAEAELRSLHHDQAKQIRQYSRRRSEPGPGFLHGETWIHDHHRSAVRRKAALDRIANSESGDSRGVVHARRRRKRKRPIQKNVVTGERQPKDV